MNMKMEAKLRYETSEQTHCPTLCSNSVGYHFRTKTCDLLKVICHTTPHELCIYYVKQSRYRPGVAQRVTRS